MSRSMRQNPRNPRVRSLSLLNLLGEAEAAEPEEELVLEQLVGACSVEILICCRLSVSAIYFCLQHI